MLTLCQVSGPGESEIGSAHAANPAATNTKSVDE
jgi:hypothetical protein